MISRLGEVNRHLPQLSWQLYSGVPGSWRLSRREKNCSSSVEAETALAATIAPRAQRRVNILVIVLVENESWLERNDGRMDRTKEVLESRVTNNEDA